MPIALLETKLYVPRSRRGLVLRPRLRLGVWLVVKGFRPSPITAEMTAATTPAAYQNAAV